MTKVYGASSESSGNDFDRSRPHGVPNFCWCRIRTVPKTSRTELNPGRRYFRCAMAAAKKLTNDDHCFKWVDEALLDEFRSMKGEILHLQEKVEMMDLKQDEVDWKIKKTIVVVTVMCLGISCFLKLF